MARLVKLLPGDRIVANDVAVVDMDVLQLIAPNGETIKFQIDATRWLEGATLTSATETAAFMSLAVAAPVVTVTVTGADALQTGDIAFTASDGNVRLITVETMPNNPRIKVDWDFS